MIGLIVVYLFIAMVVIYKCNKEIKKFGTVTERVIIIICLFVLWPLLVIGVLLHAIIDAGKGE